MPPPPVLREFRIATLRGDLLAGVMLAAVAVPECMATARLGHFAPQLGLLGFVIASLAFALAGNSRHLSAGPDSTITPVFAGALLAIGPQGLTLAPALALGVGLVLAGCGIGRLGWLSNLLSMPVLTGFLAGIAGHIALSQLPALLGVPAASGDTLARLLALIRALPGAHAAPLATGLAVMLLAGFGERWRPRVPWQLISVALAAVVVAVLMPARGIELVGRLDRLAPRLAVPDLAPQEFWSIASLSLVVGAIVLMQTCLVSRSFGEAGASGAGESRDLLGIGIANIASGLFGVFPVNASPPRTAIVLAAGGRTQLGSIFAALVIITLVLGGSGLLARIPQPALAAVLLGVAARLLRTREILDVAHRARGEFGLLVLTALAVLFLPIQIGVALGIGLSLAHGLWSATRAAVIDFEPVAGSTVWWPRPAGLRGEPAPGAHPGVRVVGFQAPLSFLNAGSFTAGVRRELARSAQPIRLLVLEASNIASIDYTAARALATLVHECRAAGVDVRVARLESLRSQSQVERYGLLALLGPDHLHHSVAEALVAAGRDPSRGELRA